MTSAPRPTLEHIRQLCAYILALQSTPSDLTRLLEYTLTQPGLHLIIFSALTSHSMPHMRHILDRALERWRLLWDNLHERYGKQGLELLGFMKHALEFWVLAKRLLRADPHVLRVEDTDRPSKGNMSVIYTQIFSQVP